MLAVLRTAATSLMKIALPQINPAVGDLVENMRLIRRPSQRVRVGRREETIGGMALKRRLPIAARLT